MDKKLLLLFDFQKFVCNKRLSSLIDGIDGKESGELSDEELKMVNAAGNIYAAAGKTRNKDE